jgi:hypothetical protein
MNSKPIQTTLKTVLIVAVVLFLLGLLIGFIPQYRRASALDQQTRRLEQQNEDSARRQALSSIRDSVALAFVEATKKNYGVAGEHTSRFFRQARELHDTTNDAAVRNTLASFLPRQDEVTAGLAQANPATVEELRVFVERTQTELRDQ